MKHDPNTLAAGGLAAPMRIADRYNRWQYDVIRPHIRGSILEIGCGVGNITQFLLESGPVLATDIAPEAEEEVRRRFNGAPTLRTRIVDLSVPGARLGERFDTVVMLNVLEHIGDEDAALRNVAAHLNQGGRFVCLVPAHSWLYSRLDRGAGHHRRYSEPMFRRVLHRNGYAVRRLIHFNPVGAAGWFFNKLFGGGSLGAGETTAQISIFDKIVPVLRLVHMDGFPFCLSLIAVAEPA